MLTKIFIDRWVSTIRPSSAKTKIKDVVMFRPNRFDGNNKERKIIRHFYISLNFNYLILDKFGRTYVFSSVP